MSTKNKRFDFDIEEDNLAELRRGYIPRNTLLDTSKCTKLFQEWREEHNSTMPDQEVLEDVLLTDNYAELCKWLCRFFTKITKMELVIHPGLYTIT